MNELVGQVFPVVGLFAWAVGLTACALWMAGRIAPWFLNVQADPPSLKSYFLDPMADTEFNKVRAVTALVAVAIMLAVLLSLAIAARLMGWEPTLQLWG
jgi:hypothetical protein